MSQDVLCALCGASAPLRDSHIAPKFVSDWLKQSSPSGYLRLGPEPNRRLQDGVKLKLLCASCETRFSQPEGQFASRVFRPVNEYALRRLDYTQWLLQFAVSISWRNLVLQGRAGRLEGEPERVVRAFQNAELYWREFLLAQRKHPGAYEQHIFFLGQASEIVPRNARAARALEIAPANLHRYMHRTTDLQLVAVPGASYIFSKLGRVLVLGFVDVDSPRKWISTKLHVGSGALNLNEPSWMSEQLLEFIVARARQVLEYGGRLTERQRSSISAVVQQSVERLREEAGAVDVGQGIAAHIYDAQWFSESGADPD